jgi:hypothetical protein
MNTFTCTYIMGISQVNTNARVRETSDLSRAVELTYPSMLTIRLLFDLFLAVTISCFSGLALHHITYC